MSQSWGESVRVHQSLALGVKPSWKILHRVRIAEFLCIFLLAQEKLGEKKASISESFFLLKPHLFFKQVKLHLGSKAAAS
jgi:hypothetical protein